MEPARSGPTRPRARFRDGLGAGSISPTTTSSAPPSPATTRRSSSSSSAIYDNGYIDKDVYQGLYCVSCEDYYTEERADRRQLPDPRHARSTEMEEENYFFKLERLRGPAARVVRRPPRGGHARSPSATRRSASSRAGCGDISITRTSITWGVPVPWDERPRLLRLVRRADQLPHRHRLRARRRARSRTWWPAVAPPDRQGDPPVPLRVVAGHVHGRRHRPAGHVLVHGWLLFGGEKLSKTMSRLALGRESASPTSRPTC